MNTQLKYQESFDFGTPTDHFNLLHSSPLGSVIVWEKLATEHAWHKLDAHQASADVRHFLDGLAGKHDTYFTVNEFNGWRQTRLLRALRANYVDIDLGRAADRHDLNNALETLKEKQLPWPSLAVFTGRGLHLYWCLNPTPASALPVWQAVQKELINALADVGSDKKARDCARVLRLVGTVNSKNMAEVRGVVLDGKPWAFHDLSNEVLGYRTAPKAKIKSFAAAQAQAGVHPKATIFRRWHLVFKDLATIGNHHKVIPDGFRNEFLFISSVALSWFAAPEAIVDEVVDFGRLYCRDVTPEEAAKAASQSVSRALRAAGGGKILFGGEERDPRYVFKRSTLWDRLGGLAAPCLPQLRAIIPDEQAAINKKERDAARWDDSYTGQGVKASNEEKRAQARLLAAQGMTQRAIAAEVGVSAMTVCRWLGL